MVTVSMEAPRSGHAGFQISKTIRCFWRTLYMFKEIQLVKYKSGSRQLGTTHCVYQLFTVFDKTQTFLQLVCFIVPLFRFSLMFLIKEKKHLKTAMFWNMKMCNLVKLYQYYGGICDLHPPDKV
jgi:hypothetical protein